MRWISAVFLACVAGCGGGSAQPCDPLAAAGEGPIALATLVGAGSHADGTVYLLDRAGSEDRVFVGTGTEVWRKRVSGAGESPIPGGTAVTVSVTETDPQFRLKVERLAAGGGRMAVLRGMTNVRDFVIGEQGDVLRPLVVADVQALKLHDLGGDVAVEYAAELPDGRRLVVVRPRDDWGYEDFRLFLGPPDRVEERKVDSVTRARDGGTTTIRFQLDGVSAEAFFPSPLNVDEPATLKHGGQTFTLTVTRGTAPTGLQFRCWK
jgi:hypothetical protein